MPADDRKAADAFRTISEVAELLDVPQHVLRFWETKFTLLRPLKRGGGRRYYRPEDIDLLRRIRRLLYDDGYTIKGVQKLMREAGSKAAFISAEAGAADPVASSGGDMDPEPSASDAAPAEAENTPPRSPVVAAALEDLKAARSLLEPFVRHG